MTGNMLRKMVGTEDDFGGVVGKAGGSRTYPPAKGKPTPGVNEVIREYATKCGVSVPEFLRVVGRIQYRTGVYMSTTGLPGSPPHGTARWRNEYGHLEVFLDGEWHVLTPPSFNWFIKTMNNELSRAEQIESSVADTDVKGLRMAPNRVAGYREPAMVATNYRQHVAKKKREKKILDFIAEMEPVVAATAAFIAGWSYPDGSAVGLVGLLVWFVARQLILNLRKRKRKPHRQNCDCIRCLLHKTCPVCMARPGESCDPGIHS